MVLFILTNIAGLSIINCSLLVLMVSSHMVYEVLTVLIFSHIHHMRNKYIETSRHLKEIRGKFFAESVASIALILIVRLFMFHKL